MKSVLLSWMLFLIALKAPGQYSITNFNSSNSGLENDYVFCVTFDAKGDPWFGLYGFGHEGGIAHYANQSWKVLRMDHPSALINNVMDIVFAPNEDMWVFSYGPGRSGDQITRWDSTGYHLMTPDGLGRRNGLSLDPHWFADIWRGLYKDTVVPRIKFFPGYPVEYPPEFKDGNLKSDIVFAKDGSAWLGMRKGLIHYFGNDNYIIYSADNSNLPSDKLEAVRIDQQGNVWVATLDHGVCIWNGDDFIVYDTSNSIIGSNVVRDIEQDHEGNMWITTWGGGVSKFTLDPSVAKESSDIQNGINTFPNPIFVNQTLTIQNVASSDLVSFELYTLEGVVLLHYDLDCEGNSCSVDILNVPPGLYIGLVSDSKGNQFNTKIMIVD